MARTYRHFGLDERRTLFRLVEARCPVTEIAARLGRHRSTVYRELGRDRFRDGDRGFCGYFPLAAQDLARRRRQRGRKLAADDSLRTHVVERLRAGWSPWQIAGRLKRRADGGAAVCHEMIYRHVYGPEGREDGFCRYLPRARARRRRGRRIGRKPRATPIPRERWIENRPAEVERRESFGRWECDLLISRTEELRLPRAAAEGDRLELPPDQRSSSTGASPAPMPPRRTSSPRRAPPGVSRTVSSSSPVQDRRLGRG